MRVWCMYALGSSSSFKLAPSTLSLFNLFLFYILPASPYACVFNSHFVHTFFFFFLFFYFFAYFSFIFLLFAYFLWFLWSFVSNVKRFIAFFLYIFSLSFENNKKRFVIFSFNFRRWLRSNVMNALRKRIFDALHKQNFYFAHLLISNHFCHFI